MEQEITLTTLFQRIENIESRLSLAIELLTAKKKQEEKEREENNKLTSIKRIPNSTAARLLRMSTRQLQRKRREYKLSWEEQGRDVFYHLAPILKAIEKFNLKWSETVLEEIKKSNLKLGMS